MNSRRKFCSGNGVPEEYKGVNHGGKVSEAEIVHETTNDFISTVNVNMLEEFVAFCRYKKTNQHKQVAQAVNQNHNDQVKAAGGSSAGFRDKVVRYFGEYLPIEVINELCKLVEENSYGKCNFCMMPIESLVLSVLQILLDASQRINETTKEKGAKDNDKSGASIGKDTLHSSGKEDFPHHCSQSFATWNANTKIQANVSKEASKNSKSNLMMNAFSNSDSPVVMPQGHHQVNKFYYVSEHVPITSKRIRTHGPSNQMHKQGTNLTDLDVAKRPSVNAKESPIIEVIGGTTFKDRSFELGKLADEIHKKRNFSFMNAQPVIDLTEVGPCEVFKSSVPTKSIGIAQVPPATNRTQNHFPVTDEERRYYNVICALAHSDRRCEKAIDFSKTNVSYCSFGESVEPNGHVDNFFVAVVCRKFFEDEHPQQSKKHYFYPSVGGCLYDYNTAYDVNTVQSCFLGANSALKLHLSDKLCFPVCIDKHWFVFIVDLRNKVYVFLDSYFDGNDNYQIKARTKLINAFKECWYQYAEVKNDVDSFSIVYPLVPKQSNKHDCGIFAVKFMELWDKNIDLRQKFSQADIPNIRVKLAVDLFFSKRNSADKSTVLNFHREGLDSRICN